ncbi:gamma-glutamylcyclotransferase family protein [Tenacibaculum xiamenense]|uniref:gamma-glutamylcyclotransferase family protein n=1 Tax=Tenacibaculum xiamenense TaxID=1261553 RepID=UPI0038933523
MEKLFVYGTLGPGKPNEHILKEIGGSWKKGYVHGKLYEEGWGALVGYPGIRLDDKEGKVYGNVFYSEKLKDNWASLDEFEGEEYQRVKVTVILEENNETIEAYVYAIRQ